MRRNLTTAIVFDELVVKGEQAHQRRCLCHVMMCCDVAASATQLSALRLASLSLATGLEYRLNSMAGTIGRHSSINILSYVARSPASAKCLNQILYLTQ